MKNENENEMSFEELYNESLKETKLEKTVTGKVISITSAGEVFVDIGYKADGIVPKKEYSDDETKNPKDEFKIGDTITCDVLKQNDGYGNVLLSYKRVKQRSQRSNLENKIKENKVFEEKVVSVSDKGLIVNVDSLRIFIPMSLSGIKKEEDINTYVGKTVKFKITEADFKQNKFIGSIKVLVDEENKKKKDEFWSSVEIGDVYTGIVSSISAYGAFVDLGGVQGLLHVSEMSWTKNVKPDEILKQGEEIEVKVIDLDKENRRLKLSYLNKGPNPWEDIDKKYSVNDIVKVKVTKFMPFGAFVELEQGIEGLVHISQIAEKNIAKPEEELKIGQHVNAKIIELDKENKKIGLSIRELEGTTNEYKEEM